jgi:hydroxymethylbilane synthase
MPETIRIGTRSSALALWQSEFIKERLEAFYPDLIVEIIHIKTKGDKILDATLSKIGDKGLFTKELEIALLDSRIDIAVHSLKDLTTTLPEGLTLGAVTKREDIRDVYIAPPGKKYKGLEELPQGATIATGSLRRRCQLLAYRPDVHICDIRGNINTRMQKLDGSEWDGMLLASAGLLRMGWQQRMTQIIEPEIILPAVGQGALGIEIREDDGRISALLGPLNDTDAWQATLTERVLLKHLEGGCQIPIGAWGRITDAVLYLDAMVGSLDGSSIVRGNIHGKPEEAEKLGIDLANELLSKGADKILEDIRQTENKPGPDERE